MDSGLAVGVEAADSAKSEWADIEIQLLKDLEG
ncbi:hypothetical protein TGVAND_278757 [Toxoplasma gondii VAND]|uniref:Uncharacterized protein n=1 Tax=Toxoplasma gondii VAND TaxID=933077 RepID=A0A086Q9H2_TOXGO|nr:hypothetical protein TGVAND_278757 [Toxoplasma gondii VAND]